MNYPSSRNETDLAPELARAWRSMAGTFYQKHPSLPQPFLTQTYRNEVDQNADYAKGRTVPGKVVTQALFGRSLHNYYPALAFDVAFKDVHGNLAWSSDLFGKLGAIAIELGIGWGGAWQGHFKDLPHFEPKGFTWHMAQAGEKPNYPPSLA